MFIFLLVWKSIWGEVELTFFLFIGFLILRDGNNDWICTGFSYQTKELGKEKEKNN